MQYPLISEYVRAIQDASDNLGELTHLVPVLDDHGEPYRSSGAFAVVFKMKDEQTGKCYALKCFTEEQEGRAEAYRQIADELEFVDSSYITSVKYLDKEIFVDSSCEEDEFPVLLMDWIDGETMESYIAENYQNNYAMAMLCYRFCKMAAWLRSQPFAHGDIKPDNIMVRPDGNLTLIDYDGMFVPAMKGQKSPTIGTKDFSHPLRTVDDFDETIDDFALASVALSLKAISLEPSLLDDYGAADRLLFSAEDYRDLSKSKVLAALHELMNDEEVNMFLSMFLLANAKKNLGLCSFRLFNLYKPNNDIQELSLMKGRCNDEQIRKKIESITSLTDEDRKKSVVLFNVAYSADGKKLVSARCDWGIEFNISNFVVDAGVEIICDGAFDGCYSLTQVKLPAGLKYIGANAFRNCLLLEYISIPKSVICLNKNPFSDWKGVLECLSPNFIYEDDVLFNKDKSKIVSFRNQKIESYIIPDSVTSIGDYAFSGCSSLSNIVIPDCVTDIGKCAFLGCSSLSNIVIPDSVTSIGNDAFSDCSSLSSIVIPDSVTDIGNDAFSHCSYLSNIVIPNSVISIGDRAFWDCSFLSNIVISDSVTNIGNGAFHGCSLPYNLKQELISRFGEEIFDLCFL